MPRAQQIARQVLLLLPVQPGGRLVEQHQARLHRKGAGEADQLLDSIREVADDALAIGLEFEKLDHTFHLVALQDLPVAAFAEVPRRAGYPVVERGMSAEEKVFERRELGEQLIVLEGPRDAAPGGHMRLCRSDVSAFERDATRGRVVGACDAIEQAVIPTTDGCDDTV